MDTFNENRDISRIENVEEGEVEFFRRLGYHCYPKPGDYLCRQTSLSRLGGNTLKHKRASVNYFEKHYDHKTLTYSPIYRRQCVRLYEAWMRQRKTLNQERVYQGMLEDSFSSFTVLLDGFRRLGASGIAVEIDHSVKGASFGFRLNQDTFCILYEVVDLSVKGLSQFIFREFCRRQENCEYINVMDDSGLDNLKRAKLSYRPQRIVPNYVIARKSE
jgi:hypothetical protein